MYCKFRFCSKPIVRLNITYILACLDIQHVPEQVVVLLQYCFLTDLRQKVIASLSIEFSVLPLLHQLRIFIVMSMVLQRTYQFYVSSMV